jgi:hypothetical protein
MIIVLPSGDQSATGSASEFTLNNVNLGLDPDGDYMCALVDVSFGNPGPTNNSVYILVDFLDYSFIGGDQFPLLYKTQPMIDDAGQKPLYYEKELGTIHQWHHISNNSINNIKVTIEQSTGEPINESFFSTLTIVIKRIS